MPIPSDWKPKFVTPPVFANSNPELKSRPKAAFGGPRTVTSHPVISSKLSANSFNQRAANSSPEK